MTKASETSTNGNLPPTMVEQPLVGHLEELRRRLIVAGGAWLVGALICYSFAQQLFQAVSAPLRQALPAGSSLVFIQATEPFFTYVKLAAMAGLLLSLPVILWQIRAFVFGTILTPPDIISQMAIAGPFLVLYEIGIFVARLCKKRDEGATREETDEK